MCVYIYIYPYTCMICIYIYIYIYMYIYIYIYIYTQVNTAPEMTYGSKHFEWQCVVDRMLDDFLAVFVLPFLKDEAYNILYDTYTML